MKIFPAPNPIMFTLGPFTIYWYGFLITIAIILGFLISLKLAKKYGIKKNSVLDLYFWLIIFGIIGARLYHVACEWQTYLADPLRIIKIWQGGLGIYGAIIAGLIVIWLYSKKNKTLMPHLSRAESRDASPVPSRVEGCLTCPEQSR
ncbi:prolipoprotein diacylglyceryl transferase, partial [Candidatus Falkowbacteria bacterium]|nr:prolipoprotein diacylglyceryl transferase [Candidatus Falkowbacteria bacterium]